MSKCGRFSDELVTLKVVYDDLIAFVIVLKDTYYTLKQEHQTLACITDGEQRFTLLVVKQVRDALKRSELLVIERCK